MDICNLKWIFILSCILIAFSGLYLAFLRELKSIRSGTVEPQDGSGNVKDGSFSFKFAIGLVLILIGIFGGYFTIKNIPGCEDRPSISKEEESMVIGKISVSWGEEEIVKKKPIQVDNIKTTLNHHCESDCQGEPTRTAYSITIDKQDGEGYLSNPVLSCIDGPCPWTENKGARLVNSKLAVGTFDVWTKPTTWKLTAEWHAKNNNRIVQKKMSRDLKRGDNISISFPTNGTNVLFYGQILKETFNSTIEDVESLNNQWIESITKTIKNGKTTIEFHIKSNKQ